VEILKKTTLLDFNIKEYVTKLGPGKGGREVLVKIFKFVLLIVLIPILLVNWIIGKLKNNKTKEHKSDWTMFKEFGDFRLFRLFISENDLPIDLDYPKESGDIYLFKLKSEPVIQQLETLYFDLNEVETKNGLYLISYNSTGKGMTLWCIDKSTKELKKVRDLLNIYWNLFNEDEETVRLRGQDEKYGYDYFVTEKRSTF
jgi:hypothetical protein